MQALLGKLRKGDRFWSVSDMRRYTFVSFSFDDMFYHSRSWGDSHGDYDAYGCTLRIRVEEGDEPLSIELRESSNKSSEPKTEEERLKLMSDTFSDAFLGYMDEGEGTLERNGFFGSHAVVWHDGTKVQVRFFVGFTEAYALYEELARSGMNPGMFDNVL